MLFEAILKTYLTSKRLRYVMERYFQPSFNINTEQECLKVMLFSEFPLSYPGGGERLIRLIYSHLSKLSADVRIIENTNKESPISATGQKLSLNIIRTKFKRFGFIKFLYQDLPPLEVIPCDKNAVSLIFLRRVPPRTILRILEKSNSKVVFCLHGMALEKLRIANPIIVAHQILMRMQLRSLAKYTRNHIFVQTLRPQVTSCLISHGADSLNIFTIENQFESEVTFPERKDKEFQVTFIGRMEDLQKGIKRLKKVIQFVQTSSKRIKFNIIGIGKDSGILNGLNGNVRVLNKIDDRRKNEILASSNLALITSTLEPYSLVVLEFLTSGVPVIATPTSGPSYILGKDPSFGKVVSFNAKSLAMSIAGYYKEWEKDKELYFSKRKDLYHMAREIVNSQKMLQSYENMVIQVAAKN